MSSPKSLPATMTVLAYLAAGSALICSFMMLRQILARQAGMTMEGQVIGWLLPSAILFSAAVLARLSGHLHARGFIGALLIVGPCWLFLEGISVWTSYLSVNLGIESARIEEQANSQAGQAAAAVNQAANTATAKLASDIENMPRNYFGRRGEAVDQMTALMAEQRALIELQQNQQTATASAIDSGMQKRWALAIALALSVAVLAVQFGLGVTSDGAQAARARRWQIFGDDEKKSRGLYSVK